MTKPTVQLFNDDCRNALKALPDASVDSVVTDPPYELGFMGKGWDASGIAYDVSMWREVLRVLKPGGHVLAFGGTRTYHRMAVAIEDAGFEIRDSIHWIYGSGFPKSLDVSKAMDKAAGAERKVLGKHPNPGSTRARASMGDGWQVAPDITAPATDAAREWDGWGTALKPAHEPIVVARKPLVGTVAANVQAHETGAINIDGCRVGVADWGKRPPRTPNAILGGGKGTNRTASEAPEGMGRWPPNILLSHTPECGEACAEDCAVAEMDRQSGVSKSTGGRTVKRSGGGNVGSGKTSEKEWSNDDPGYGDTGGASRFFPVFRYQAKASRSERNAGLEAFPESLPKAPNGSPNAVGATRGSLSKPRANIHPTVKPVALMRWLVRLVTPPGGVVLEPFMGSGTTGVACVQEGFAFIGIEREPQYFEICKARIDSTHCDQPVQSELFA